jgi:hypothetical protein
MVSVQNLDALEETCSDPIYSVEKYVMCFHYYTSTFFTILFCTAETLLHSGFFEIMVSIINEK